MASRRMQLLGLTATVLVGASPAWAGDWGTLEQAKVCEKEYGDSKGWGNLHSWPYPIVAKLKDGSVSSACKTEIVRRAATCANDGTMKGIYRDISGQNAGMTMSDMCNYRAFGEIIDQFNNVVFQKQQAEEKAKKEAEENAAAEKERLEKVNATELPKAGKKDPALEKAVATAYMKDYPGNKVLKVILDGWSDDMEKDALGRITGRDMSATVVNKHADGKCELHYELWLQHGNGRSFSGPLSARGAGSMTTNEILCSKVGGAASAPAAKKKKK